MFWSVATTVSNPLPGTLTFLVILPSAKKGSLLTRVTKSFPDAWKYVFLGLISNVWHPKAKSLRRPRPFSRETSGRYAEPFVLSKGLT